MDDLTETGWINAPAMHLRPIAVVKVLYNRQNLRDPCNASHPGQCKMSLSPPRDFVLHNGVVSSCDGVLLNVMAALMPVIQRMSL